jgi:hypothetical protein
MTRRFAVAHGDVSIEVLSDGDGPRVVPLPSLGRGAEDFDAIAAKLAAAHFLLVRPQPHGNRGRAGIHPHRADQLRAGRWGSHSKLPQKLFGSFRR